MASPGQVDELLAACWEETLDAGLYDFGDKDIDWGKGAQAPAAPAPGGVTMESINLMEQIQPALTPLFNIIDTVVAVFNCIKAIPDSLGPPPDPTVLAACIPELAEKVSALLKLLPQLSLPYTIIGIIDLVIDTLRQARSQLLPASIPLSPATGSVATGASVDRATAAIRPRL